MFANTSLLFISLSVALQVVLASSVKITYPKANAVLKAGSTVNIKWHVNDEKAGPIRLQYASGKPDSLNVDGIIADNVTASHGSYSWKIPSDIKPKKYVIEAGPSAKDLSFVGYVTIKKGTKKTSTKKTKKPKKSVCIGYPSKKGTDEHVSCHPIPTKKTA